MAVSLRNRQIEAEIHAIGKRLGKGPTDVLRHRLEDHRAQEEARKAALVERRRRASVAFMASTPFPIDEDRARAQEAIDAMYGENGLPT
jgi:hypothetical protein